MSEPFVELTDEEWDARVDVLLAEHPGLFPRHAAMFVTLEENGRRARHEALEWEREKGHAFAEGMAEGQAATPKLLTRRRARDRA